MGLLNNSFPIFCGGSSYADSKAVNYEYYYDHLNTIKKCFLMENGTRKEIGMDQGRIFSAGLVLDDILTGKSTFWVAGGINSNGEVLSSSILIDEDGFQPGLELPNPAYDFCLVKMDLGYSQSGLNHLHSGMFPEVLFRCEKRRPTT